MNTKAKTAPEATPEVLEAERTATVEQPKEPEKDFLANLPDPCVYCGPSVRGVAQQFRVYNGGIPEPLREFVRKHRAARGLLVSVERFAAVRKRLETPGTGEFILYNKVRAEM